MSVRWICSPIASIEAGTSIEAADGDAIDFRYGFRSAELVAFATFPLYTPGADMERTSLNRRFGPKRTYAVQRVAAYSITSSARREQRCRHGRPSVLAVLRLMTSLELGRGLHGRSAGFSPLRIRST